MDRPRILRSIFVIRRVLPTLKTATVPGQTGDGTEVWVRYRVGFPRTVQQRDEMREAKSRGMSLLTYTGSLDRVWTNKSGAVCFTLLTTNRLKDGHYTYRTFNVEKGYIDHMIVY